MTEQGPTVSVVVLSYNRPHLLREALRSLSAQSCAPHEIIVVDNRSPRSAEVARVVSEFPSAQLVANDANLGYAAGMNRGIRLATGCYTYLTEDDITLDADCLRHLVTFLETSATPTLAAPLMYNRGAGTIRCAGGSLSLGGIYRRTTFAEGAHDTGQFPRPFHVSYIDGAGIFARTRFLQETGGFREDFFMYVEAVEFCARVEKRGGRLALVPAAKTYHFEPGANANDSPELNYHRVKNLFALYVLHAPLRVLPEFALRYVVWGTLRSLSPGSGGRGAARAHLSALVWLLKRLPSLARERRAGDAGAGDARGALARYPGASEEAASQSAR